MKVHIGPYVNWVGPYQIADKIFFWVEKYPDDETLYKRWDYKLHDKFGTWLADTWVASFCEWVHKFKKQKQYVKIDYYDHWSCDSTLTPIILPLLKSLKEHKQGSGFIDMEDVPESMRFTETEEWDAQTTFEFYDKCEDKMKCDVHTRYEWALDEMIWAFEQLNSGDWEDQYWKTRPEIDFTEHEEDKGKTLKPVRWKVEGVCDWEGRKKHQARIDNGLRLFGKYFQTLWD